MVTKRRLAIEVSVTIALVLLAGVQLAMAQGPGEPDHVSRWTLGAASGGIMTSTTYSLRGTSGQMAVGLATGTDRYEVAGIWPPNQTASFSFIDPEMPPPDEPPEIPEDQGETPGEGTSPVAGEPLFPGPEIFQCPVFPELTSPDFPATLGLPEMPELIPLSYITEVFNSIISLTQAILLWDTVIDSSLLIPEALAAATGIGIDDFGEEEGTPDLGAIEIAGYTPAEMADELVSGMDTALSYIRGIQDIGVIGPTAVALLLGIVWIAFIAFAKIVVKSLFGVIHIVVEIWRLLPFT
jgi:hypothetical protein